MDAKIMSTPSSSQTKQFCPLCQCPFKVLAVDTPAIHMQKCKFRQMRPRGECPDGVHCIQTLPAHYSQYSHNILEKFRNNPESAPQTPKRCRSIEQMFRSLHGKARKVKTKQEWNAPVVKNSPSSRLNPVLIDLSDSQTSSEEFSNKSSQSSVQSSSKTLLNRTSSKSRIKSPFTSIRVKQEPGTMPQKHKINPCKRSTSKNAKKPKLSTKLSVKTEKGNDENPWSIAASQATKSPFVCKIYSVQNDDIIDLTDDITPPIDTSVSGDHDDTLEEEKDVNENNVTLERKSDATEKCIDSNKNNEKEMKKAGSEVTNKVRVNLSKKNSLNEWLKSPQKNKPTFSRSMKILDSPSTSSESLLPPKTFQVPNFESPCSDTTPVHNASLESGKSLPTTQETIDSEEWGVEPPRGPGFVPVSPIEPKKNYVTTQRIVVSSDDEYLSEDSAESNLQQVTRKASKKLKFPTSTQRKKDTLPVPDNSNITSKATWPKKGNLNRVVGKETAAKNQSATINVNTKKQASRNDLLHVPVNSTPLGKAAWPNKPSVGENQTEEGGTKDENVKRTESNHQTDKMTDKNEMAGPSNAENRKTYLTKKTEFSPGVAAKKPRLGSTRRLISTNTNSSKAEKIPPVAQETPTSSTQTDIQTDTPPDKSSCGDDDEDDELLNCSLLLGQTQMFTSTLSTLPWKASSTNGVASSEHATSTSTKAKEDGASKKCSDASNNTDKKNIGLDPQNAKTSTKEATATTANLSSTATTSQSSSSTKGPKLRPSDQNTPNSAFSQKPKTKQADIGSMLFGMKPKVRPEPVSDENSLPKQPRYYGKGNYTGKPRSCPFYKKVEGTNIAVDAFSYGTVEGIEFYLLSHYHYDHYQGLTKKYWKHKVYCSEITGNLVSQKIGLPKELIVSLPMEEECQIGRVNVTLLEANHCPGAVLFLFKLPHNRIILHTGDFRAGVEHYTALQGVNVDLLYLDTTYLDPSYQFPPQNDVINTAVSIATESLRRNPKTLFAVGTYLIGKERIFAAIAKAINSTAFVAADKYRTIQCLMDDELSSIVTKTPDGARVHVVAMKSLNQKELKSRLQKYKEFDEIVAIKPTGWTHDKTHPDLSDIRPVGSSPVRIYGLPYSEHSSFEDLRGFVKFLRPKKIIPTVNVARKESRDMMSRYLDKWKLGLDV